MDVDDYDYEGDYGDDDYDVILHCLKLWLHNQVIVNKGIHYSRFVFVSCMHAFLFWERQASNITTRMHRRNPRRIIGVSPVVTKVAWKFFLRMVLIPWQWNAASWRDPCRAQRNRKWLAFDEKVLTNRMESMKHSRKRKREDNAMLHSIIDIAR